MTRPDPEALVDPGTSLDPQRRSSSRLLRHEAGDEEGERDEDGQEDADPQRQHTHRDQRRCLRLALVEFLREAMRLLARVRGEPLRLLGELNAKGKSRETIRKTVTVLTMVLDHAGVTPNPARDRVHVRLPREDRPEIQPPSADDVEAVHHLLAPTYRLPLLVLDATGMRVGEFEALTWGDVDEARGRWRVSRTVAKTGRARWVNVAPALFAAVLELCPRDYRHPERRVFENMTADRLRPAISRACTAAGVSVFSPHDLRHRRISLLHLGGLPWATIGQGVGQRNLAVTANTYTHVLADERELDYPNLLA